MTERDLDTVQARERIAIAAGVALLVAGAILLTAVLPAEYGLDPFGTGKALGLTALAQARGGEESAAATPEPGQSRVVSPQSGVYKVDSVVFKLGPREGFEYKYRIEKDAGMVYAWKATGAVQYEFHGERDGAAEDEFESYEKTEGDQASGTFTAPFSGIHGWFWENPSDRDLTVTLTSSGFYSAATEYRESGPAVHELSDVKTTVVR